jgi:hypothetical protein
MALEIKKILRLKIDYNKKDCLKMKKEEIIQINFSDSLIWSKHA